MSKRLAGRCAVALAAIFMLVPAAAALAVPNSTHTAVNGVHRTPGGTYLGQFTVWGDHEQGWDADGKRRRSGRLVAAWSLNNRVLRGVRYRHVVTCHRARGDFLHRKGILLDPEYRLAYREVRSPTTSNDRATESYSTAIGVEIDDYRWCAVVRHRFNVTYVGESRKEHRFTMLDFARYE